METPITSGVWSLKFRDCLFPLTINMCKYTLSGDVIVKKKQLSSSMWNVM